jgi:hypothetical protein
MWVSEKRMAMCLSTNKVWFDEPSMEEVKHAAEAKRLSFCQLEVLRNMGAFLIT